ncbi:MAG: hypothetical protein ACRDK5_02750 [Solirubrobacterales bacterium]
MREFRTSAIFGLVGVFVVAGIAIAIALTADPSNSNPKLQMGLIFGVIAVFVVALLLFQRQGLERAAAGDVRGFGKGPQEVDDPTKLGDGELWAALAVKPIDREALKARESMWGAARRGLKLGALIFLLIFVAVPPIYLFDTYVPFLIGVPLIIIAALYGSFKAIGPGGDVDTGYDNMNRAMKPLGLSLAERPKVRMVQRWPTDPTGGYSARLFGPLVLTGERHGRKIDVRQIPEDGTSEVIVHASVPSFDAKSKGGRFPGGDGVSNAAPVLSRLAASDRWKKVEVHGGRDGIVVERKSDPGAWLCDLWLAERLADEL